MIIFTSTIPSAHCMSSLRRAISNLYDDAHADKPAFATITVSNLAKYSALPTLRKFDRLLTVAPNGVICSTMSPPNAQHQRRRDNAKEEARQ
jgi:hypothetical protein